MGMSLDNKVAGPCPLFIPAKILDKWKFDKFAQWAALRGLGYKFTESARKRFGITDEHDEAFLALKTQAQLARHLDIRPEQLSRWKKTFHKESNDRAAWYLTAWFRNQSAAVLISIGKGIATGARPPNLETPG